MDRTHYDVMMIGPGADRELIGVVYRHLAKRYHPDRDPSPEAAARMTELNGAYAVLRDADERARYDIRIGLADPGPSPVRPGSDRPTRAGSINPDVPSDSPYGEAGPPPTTPIAEGQTLTFGRYRGWALNQVDRYDRDYIDWLSRTTMGRNYKRELDSLRHQR